MVSARQIPNNIVDVQKTIKQLKQLIDDGQQEKADTFGLGAIKKSPQSAELYHLLAVNRMEGDKLVPALEMAEKALQLAPNNAAYKLFVGRLFLELGVFEFSQTLLSEVAAAHTESFEVYWAMAVLQLRIGKGENAIPLYDMAVKHCRDFSRAKRLKLERAICRLQIGQIDLGRAELETMRGDPDVGTQALQTCVVYARKSDVVEMIPLVEKILVSGETDASGKATFELALGRLYELQGKHDDAFLHWAKSREISSSLDASKPTINVPVNVIAQLYCTQAYDAVRQYCNLTELSIFIGGMARSGTTLTEQILGSHSAIAGVGELSRMNMLDDGFMYEYQTGNYLQRLTDNAKKGELLARAEETLKMLAIIGDAKKPKIVEKTPDNWLAFGYIHMVFPNTKLIHCERHPADSFISAFQNLEGSQHRHVYDQKTYAERYLLKQSYMKYWKQCFPDNIFEVKYEELVRDPETVVKALIKFVGLPWEDACLKFFENKSTVLTYSSAQVRNPIYTSSIGRWKKYEKHLGPLFEALKDANFEYPEA